MKKVFFYAYKSFLLYKLSTLLPTYPYPCDADDPGELASSGSCCGGAAAGMVSDEADARSDVEADAF
eukprot:g13539.t1